MKIETPKYIINKVIKVYEENLFTEFTLENTRPLRQSTGLGQVTIKKIILEYNTSKSAQHPNTNKVVDENVR